MQQLYKKLKPSLPPSRLEAQEKWSKGRCREKQTRQHEQQCQSNDSISSEIQEIVDVSPNKSRKIHYQSEYIDNSSEQSNSVTPLSQSPFHRAIQKTTSSLSQKFAVFQNTEINQMETSDISNKITFQDCRNGDTSDVVTVHNTEQQNSQNSQPEQVEEHQKKDQEEVTVSKDTALRQYSFFQLRIHLKCGRNLVAKDKNGTSDPYVKFKINGKLVYKSKTIYRDLNPLWDESFTLPIEDPFVPVHIKVFDYDWGLQDDFIGSANLNVTQLDFGKLGNEKYKSKVTYKTLNPKWLEQFDLHLYDDQSQELEITVWDKDWTTDDFMGRCSVMLDSLEREKTHKITKELEDGCGSISLLLTISGTTASETISDLTTYEENEIEMRILKNRYALSRTLHNLKDVGHLTVKVYKAQGLASADICGKSDPFCVVELVNARLQTQTEYKTLTPSWQKIFTFNVKDIHSVLEVTVYDEDKDHKVEFLGKVAIPLLRIRNNEKRWYALKDKKLHGRAKGNSPQILLEMNVIWNQIQKVTGSLYGWNSLDEEDEMAGDDDDDDDDKDKVILC
ncbi:hypothetical protein PGB90_000889 [Kerria lacca]